jgi:Nucleoside-diphosphate-sugar epimerases
VFISGGTGYVGRRLLPELLRRSHAVRSLVRPGSEDKICSQCAVTTGDVLNSQTFSMAVPPADTFIHLVGVPRPAPWKGKAFRALDLPSLRASLAAAQEANIRHFIYISVAQPAPVMKAYVKVRSECEALIQASGLSATILRPWYIIGPGHYWPMVLWPVYKLLECVPETVASARRLGLVTIQQMVAALVWTIEHPADAIRIVDVPGIRALASTGC